MSVSPGDQDRAFPDGRPLSEQPRCRQDFPTDIPADDALARREFTKFLVLTSGAFVAGQCWIVSCQLRLAAGRAPSSGSVAEPENGMTWPTENLVPTAGVEMTGTGGLLVAGLTVIGTVAGVLGRPWLSVTRRAAVKLPAAG